MPAARQPGSLVKGFFPQELRSDRLSGTRLIRNRLSGRKSFIMSLVSFHRLLLASGRGNLLRPRPGAGQVSPLPVLTRGLRQRLVWEAAGQRACSPCAPPGEPFLTRRFPHSTRGATGSRENFLDPSGGSRKQTGPGMEAGPLCPRRDPALLPAAQTSASSSPPGHPPALFLEQAHALFLSV